LDLLDTPVSVFVKEDGETITFEKGKSKPHVT